MLFFVTEDWYFCLHWLPLATALRDAGYQVSVLTQISDHADRIEAAGLRVIPLTLSRKGTNPFKEIGLLWRLAGVLRKEQPDLLHNIAQKPVLYGTFVARITGIPAVFNTLAGLGFLFTSNAAKARLLRPLVLSAYRRLLGRRHVRVTVQNPEDQTHLAQSAHVDATLIRGAGVDLARFIPHPEPVGPVTVMLASRMLWDKGIAEFAEAASRIRETGLKARFVLVGKPDEGNPSAVSQSQMDAWNADGILDCWGFREDMPDVLAQAHIICLPSYREGLPTILIEAAAAGLPLVATDVPGCREVVQNDKNGLLVAPHDAEGLADALLELIKDAERRRRFGLASRALAEQCFGIDRVAADTLAVYRQLMPPP